MKPVFLDECASVSFRKSKGKGYWTNGGLSYLQKDMLTAVAGIAHAEEIPGNAIWVSDEGFSRIEALLPTNTPYSRLIAGAKVMVREAANIDLNSLLVSTYSTVIARTAKILDATDGLHPAVARVAELEKQLSEASDKVNQVSRAYNGEEVATSNQIARLSNALALARTKVSPDHPVQKEIDAILKGGAA